jgi:glucosamine--fructose-6-phosphate aminotransferase (isomerizing)
VTGRRVIPDDEPALARLLEEIGQQPSVVAGVIESQAAAIHRLARAIRERPPTVVVFAARGSSDNAAVYGRYLLETCNRLLTSLAAPSTVTLYGSGPRLDGTLVIGVSQSGQGEDVVAYVRRAREQGAMTLAVVNDASSPLAGEAAWVLECRAGPEVSVPATKTVTAQMTLLALLAAALADEGGDGRQALAGAPSAVEKALAQRAAARPLARALAEARAVSVVGRGFAFPVALETALKLKETSYTEAEPFSTADFYHGPVALLAPDHRALLVDVGGTSREAAHAAAADVQRRGGACLVMQSGSVDEAPVSVPTLAAGGALDEPYAPIPAVVLGQVLAVEVALARGLNPALPRGLTKVTSTR